MGEVVLSVDTENYCLWAEYYQEFPDLADQLIRPGCHPRKLLHENRTDKAIVLVHGLTDSPFYMAAIGEYFHHALGYNVYLPLLQCHGLQHPQGMGNVSLTQWKKNVLFALRAATEKSDRVSIGGFSTGGALSLYFGCTDPMVTGDIYLFSAALGLSGRRFGVFGCFAELCLRLPYFRLLDNKRPLVGSHPYRYARVPLISAGELVRLIVEINELRKFPDNKMSSKRIFAAWSESDQVINLRKINGLKRVTSKDQFVPFIIPKEARVDHACVVLKKPIYAIGSQRSDNPLEVANPVFAQMMDALGRFESTA
jgi:pimeloyl-ACP methyl ester carboxylesterase